ncbi:uncharacterized protein LOC119381046 [Rhipicephalus sanguineus]|uniref:uncharacterized protein LOC119381046 n=1 Tax=Rhipicephalus sanguineus TaxID=34632 RepID=UPI00189366BA|nr:uncharacterized protein LOC119381046 [Rhipicephalus sanguineus]
MSTDSPPLKKRKIRQCTFRKEWRSQPEYESWLLPVDDDATAARCTICASTFTVKFDGVSAVKHHASTQKHKQKSLASKQSATVKKFFVPAISSAEDHVTAAELGTIFHGIKHNYSYLSMDCGSKLAPKVFSDSDIASRMRLGRTKMEHLVKDVLAPYAVECIVEKLRPAGRNLPFALSTDASNKGNRKLFPIAVRFYDVSGAGITDALIDFCEQADETSGGICELLATSLEKVGLSLERAVAYSADNASVNYGKHNSVFQKMQKDQPTLLKANCNCHVVHNTAKHAVKSLKFDVETLVLKVFKEFSSSSKCVEELKTFFEFCDQEYSKVLCHISVRWLSLFTALDRLIKNWTPIKSYFLSQGEEECEKIIWRFISNQADGLSESVTLPECYMHFMHSFLAMFHSAILTLEKSHLEPTELYAVMTKLRKQLINRRDDMFFGVKANLGLEILPGGQVAKLEFLNVYDRALAYLEKWFDFENSPFKMLAELDLRKGAPTTLVVINAGNLFGIDFQEEGDELYSELCLLKDALPGLLKCDEKSSSMWLKFLKAVKCPLLQNLMEHVYSIPCSNAFVERVFSVMGNLWTDERNQLSVPMVKAELCVRYNLVYSCEEFVKMARENKKLIRAAKSNSKYIFKFRE